MTSALEVRELTLRYGDVTAVAGATLAVAEGEIFCLVGASGCGKTSLLRAVAGFEVPSTGEIRIGGETVCAEGRWVEPERRRVGMVFQEGALFPHMTVRENVGFGLKAPRSETGARIDQVLEWVGLETLGERFPDQLSGGQRQRAALARALAPAPRLVLLDEPFASLDAARRVRLRAEVCAALRHAGATAVFVTHDQEEALSIADKLAVMREGRILQCATPEEIYEAPGSVEVADFIGNAQLLECAVRDRRLDTPLGALDTDAPDGPARLLLRPECLALVPAGAPDSVPATLRRAAYFGHDALYDAELGDGTVLRVRCFGAPQGESRDNIAWSGSARRCRLFTADGAYWAKLPA